MDAITLALGSSVLAVLTTIAAIVFGFARGRALPQAPNQLERMPIPSAPVDLNSALETVLVKAMESQAGMFERMQKLNVENATLAAEQVRTAINRRGGRRRAQTGRRNHNGIYVRNCRLCSDPMITDPTVAEIVAHSVHKAGGNLNISQSRNGPVEAHVDESQLTTDGSGVEDECETCGGKHLPGQQHLFNS